MSILKNPFRGRGIPADVLRDAPMPSTHVEAPRDMLRRCPAADETPLVRADDLAAQLGLSRLWLKDERTRMGLGSFKALGAAYVIACDHANGTAMGQTYVTASAGNHGLSVAAGAAAFKANAVVYLSETVPEGFAARLTGIGAKVVRAGADYEESMAAAAKAAAATGAVLLSDSSWQGYMDRPYRLMEGYTVLMAEIFEQIDDAPSHILLQAGVGGLAAACAAMARAEWGDAPQIIVVEPEAAPALQASIKAGKPVTAAGRVSAMGRLDCKDPSLIALHGLACDADLFVTISEDTGQNGTNILAQAGYPSTPSGCAGVAALEDLNLPKEARVLAILSEEATA